MINYYPILALFYSRNMSNLCKERKLYLKNSLLISFAFNGYQEHTITHPSK